MEKEVISQYKASLKMLEDVINKCPQELWENNHEYENAYWRIVYHTLFYASLYLEGSKFVQWEKHKINYNRLGSFTHENEPIIVESIYSKNEMLDYLKSINNKCEDLVKTTAMEDESGFDWLTMNKRELQFYNIRHIQHHVGQLVERLHQIGIKGISWEGRVSD